MMLNGTDLPENLRWTDEFDWLPRVQAFARAENGVQIREESALVAGRPITLSSDWVSRTDLLALYALASTPGATYTLALADGRTFSVAFVGDKPITAQPVIDYAAPAAGDWYELTLKLITV